MTDATARTVHVIVPEGVGDRARVSGGNVFDQRIVRELPDLGWTVRMSETGIDGGRGLAALLAQMPDAALVLVDGLVACGDPAAIEEESERLRIVVVAHMVAAAFPGAEARTIEGERRALGAARGVIATSAWCGAELVRRGAVPAERVVVATPGSDDAPLAEGTAGGGSLLCVGVVAAHKGQDTLIEALAAVPLDADWTCTIAGSLATDPGFSSRIAASAADAGIGDRVVLAGVLAPDDLADAYQRADLLVAPSRVESYGMAVVDALRRGIPVVASTAGGLPQTLAHRAAILVPPGESAALGEVLGRWMTDPGLRARLKAEAAGGRSGFPRWGDTAGVIARTLESLR